MQIQDMVQDRFIQDTINNEAIKVGLTPTSELSFYGIMPKTT